MTTKDPVRRDPIEAIGEAYELMLERALEEYRKAKEHTAPALKKLVDDARDKATELGELTREEAEKVADALKRDIADLGDQLSETGAEIRDWLGFETSLLESSLLNLISQAADKVSLELRSFKEGLDQRLTRHTGEVTGPGVLVCTNCNERLEFRHAGKVPPCPKCHGTGFRREVARGG